MLPWWALLAKHSHALTERKTARKSVGCKKSFVDWAFVETVSDAKGRLASRAAAAGVDMAAAVADIDCCGGGMVVLLLRLPSKLNTKSIIWSWSPGAVPNKVWACSWSSCQDTPRTRPDLSPPETCPHLRAGIHTWIGRHSQDCQMQPSQELLVAESGYFFFSPLTQQMMQWMHHCQMVWHESKAAGVDLLSGTRLHLRLALGSSTLA